MKLREYDDYDEYVSAQLWANERKRSGVWASRRAIYGVAAWLRERFAELKITGVCHGVRTGAELQWFGECGIDALGTEIGIVDATDERILRHDFNLPHARLAALTFIYSNSLDHSPDPERTLSVWRDQLRPDGVLVIDWAKSNGRSTASDPFSASVDEVAALVEGGGARVIERTKHDKGTLLYVEKL